MPLLPKKKIWSWYERIHSFDSENTTASAHTEILLDDHNKSVAAFAEAFARKLGLPDELVQALQLAGGWHDLGKARGQWQRSIGNRNPEKRLAKSAAIARLKILASSLKAQVTSSIGNRYCSCQVR